MADFRITPTELAREIVRSRVSLLIGSGTSTACGLPTWDKLIGAMKTILRKRISAGQRQDLENFFKSRDSLKIAEQFRRELGDPEYFRFLRQRYRHRNFTLAPTLRTLPRLGITTVFTTNYDKLLEIAFRNSNGEDPVVVFDHLQLSGLATRELRIVKLHGDIDHPKSIVLSERDYQNYEDRYSGLEQYFTGQMAFGGLLLVGFGLRDPNFDRIYQNVQKLMKGGSRVIAVMANQNRFDIEAWESRNLEIIHLPSYSQIAGFLGNVARHR